MRTFLIDWLLILGTLITFPMFLPAQEVVPAVALKAALENAPGRNRDLSKEGPAFKQVYLSAQRGMTWLHLTNKPDGRFVYGFLPALRVPMEGDHFVHQAGAAFALARSARYFGDELAAAKAKQAVLSLLLETAPDPREPRVRTTAAPPGLLNRLASNGALLLAIHELPAPASDLLQHSDGLANFLFGQIDADGSFKTGETDPRKEAEIIQNCTGLALAGLVRSQEHHPAPWKLATLRKACPLYLGWWRSHKNMPMIPTHTTAYAEAYRLTREPIFAQAVFEMNDWLCSLQYQEVAPSRNHWIGGFQAWTDGKVLPIAPDISSGPYAESLAEACRVAKQMGDVQRYERYRRCLESALLFLTSLQYTEARVQHYAEFFRPAILGAFHASHQDGNLRIDFTQHPLSGMVSYLQHLTE